MHELHYNCTCNCVSVKICAEIIVNPNKTCQTKKNKIIQNCVFKRLIEYKNRRCGMIVHETANHQVTVD